MVNEVPEGMEKTKRVFYGQMNEVRKVYLTTDIP